MGRIEGPQDLKLEFPDVIQECPRCLDERLINLASATGYLVCRSCDLVVRDTLKLDDAGEIRRT